MIVAPQLDNLDESNAGGRSAPHRVGSCVSVDHAWRPFRRPLARRSGILSLVFGRFVRLKVDVISIKAEPVKGLLTISIQVRGQLATAHDARHSLEYWFAGFAG